MKPLIKYWIAKLINYSFPKSKKINSNSILIVRLDAIGDYILFRNFIKILKDSTRYKNYSFNLLGNIAWKELAEFLDKKYIDNFIWIDPQKFNRNIRYRIHILKKISSKGYEILIHPTFSRTLDADMIVNFINANTKIGSTGDLSNIHKLQKKFTDKFYTNLIPASKDIIFEFYRNKEFFEYLMNRKIDIRKPYVNLNKIDKNKRFKIQKKYAVLFIGASVKLRKWPISNFVKIGEFLKKKYNYEVIVCGGPKDIYEGKVFKDLAKYNYIDLIGKTSIKDLLFIFKNSEIIISNETFAPHLAVALNVKKVVVISNGNHYGRFNPYPPEIYPDYHAIYPPEIEKEIKNKNYDLLIKKYGFGSSLDISKIETTKVQEELEKIL